MIELTERLRAPIRTRDDGFAFIAELERLGLMWHFDDDPLDCLHETPDDGPLVHRFDAVFLGLQRDRLFRLDWGVFEDPHGAAIHLQKMAGHYEPEPEEFYVTSHVDFLIDLADEIIHLGNYRETGERLLEIAYELRMLQAALAEREARDGG